jgi:tetratricopeptide (TPR) repeat protein
MAGFAFFAARLAYAEIQFRRDTPVAITRAAELDRFAPPAGYFERLADLDPEHAAQWLDAALQANPRLSAVWIAQGLAAEAAGDIDRAERDFLQAARVDRQYLPAWTLANFYFRRESPGQFWIWARRAAELTYDDFRPLLALAHAVEPSPRAVLEKLGGSEPLLRADLDYLTARERFDDAQEVARLMLGRRPASGVFSETPRLLELAERQIRAGNAAYALELWISVHPSSVNPEESSVLANGELLQSPSGVAFDWRLPRTDGEMAAWQPSQLTFSLSGDQPESCALLEQIVSVSRANRYRLHFEYFTAGIASPTGLVWDLDGDEAPALKPANAWIASTAVLRASTGSLGRASLGKLRLLYRREPGTVRVQGRLLLRHLRMEVL